jgi:transglutaminase-like putative cysteine protease
MRFHIHHRTCYRYAGSAMESFMESRLQPAMTPHQKLLDHRIEIEPECNLHSYEDYFGNQVQTFSIIRRHEQLVLDSYAEVETRGREDRPAAWEVSISESRQIYRSDRLRNYEFLHASPAIRLDTQVNKLANRFFRTSSEIGPAVRELNAWIHGAFTYQTGATHIGTTVAEVLKTRTGVCQDFAQVMIAILRSAEIPARYVVGYIETDSQRQAAKRGKRSVNLVGAAESHAWVEIKLPGGEWWPFDPTNNCEAGERHVKVAVGRDYRDCTPTRGVFKGTHTERLSVSVKMIRQ